MFTIKEFTVELVADPFKILIGDRYEFILDLEVDEEDELFDEAGVRLRVIYVVVDGSGRIVNYEFLSAATGKYIDVEMEEDETALVSQFCEENYKGD